jgi:hypothetical protein
MHSRSRLEFASDTRKQTQLTRGDCIERTLDDYYGKRTMTHFLRSSSWGRAGLVCLLAARAIAAAEPVWPQFRGPEANPVSNEVRLVDNWGKTKNIDWVVEVPGRGWSSPIVSGERVFVTTAITEGESKPPQIGTEYSNEYAAEIWAYCAACVCFTITAQSTVNSSRNTTRGTLHSGRLSASTCGRSRQVG